MSLALLGALLTGAFVCDKLRMSVQVPFEAYVMYHAFTDGASNKAHRLGLRPMLLAQSQPSSLRLLGQARQRIRVLQKSRCALIHGLSLSSAQRSSDG